MLRQKCIGQNKSCTQYQYKTCSVAVYNSMVFMFMYSTFRINCVDNLRKQPKSTVNYFYGTLIAIMLACVC